jgi:hypothetical protein
MNRWVKVSGPLGGYFFIVLSYRMRLGKFGKLESVTLPREVKRVFGLSRKMLERLRFELTNAGLLETTRDPGRPYKYKILDGK